MSVLQNLVGLVLVVVLFSACEKWDFDEKNFIEVEITNFESLALDSVMISGVLNGIATGNVQDHGFVWNLLGDGEPLIFFNNGSRSLGIKVKDESPVFSSIIQLTPGTQYNVRAYATDDGENYVYSDIQSFTTDGGSVSTLSFNYQRGFSLDISGQLSGTEKGVFAVEHGFCWSIVNQEPNLSDDFLNLGTRNNNDVFTSTIDGLEDGAPTYLRAYSILTLDFVRDTVFGETLTFDGNLNFWEQLNDFTGLGRYGQFSFVIDDKAYMGTGTLTDFSQGADFWEYDSSTDSWTQLADYGGGGIDRAVGFAIGKKGYAGTGIRVPINTTKDFWEYDPQTNIWTEKAPFGGAERFNSVAFAINDKGYIGTGGSFFPVPAAYSDFWEYDPQSDSWTKIADYPGGTRVNSVSFVIDNIAYVGTGAISNLVNSQSMNPLEFWKYNPANQQWSQIADFIGLGPTGAVGFSINNTGYVGLGSTGEVGPVDTFWEYNVELDTWTERASFEGGKRSFCLGFSVDGKAFVGLGLLSGVNEPQKDLWTFNP